MNAPELTRKLRKMNACDEAMYWQTGKSLEEVWNTCERGDWMLWLFRRVYKGEERLLYLIAGHCANTVRHLMKDERSIAAVDAAISYSEGRIEKDGLRKAYAAAAATTAYADAAYAADAAAAADDDAAYADAADAAAAADDVAYADAAYAAAAADDVAYADAADAAAYAAAAYAAAAATTAAGAAAYAAAAAARSQNRKQAADIVRQFVSIELITQCVYEHH